MSRINLGLDLEIIIQKQVTQAYPAAFLLTDVYLSALMNI